MNTQPRPRYRQLPLWRDANRFRYWESQVARQLVAVWLVGDYPEPDAGATS